jgi:hypothetical protein
MQGQKRRDDRGDRGDRGDKLPGGAQPDPMKTSFGYIGADTFTRQRQGQGQGQQRRGGGGHGRRQQCWRPAPQRRWGAVAVAETAGAAIAAVETVAETAERRRSTLNHRVDLQRKARRLKSWALFNF